MSTRPHPRSAARNPSRATSSGPPPAGQPAAWFEAQYNNRARVPEAPRIIEQWAAASAVARQGILHRIGQPYGPSPAQTLDIFAPSEPNAPVLVFIHGGYWRSLDKSDFSFIAPAFREAGAMVVVPNYSLCPAVGIDDIALEMAQALAWTYAHAEDIGGDPSRIVLVGHSAGGHLAAMLMACDWAAMGRSMNLSLPADLAGRAMSISGLFDLAPLAQTPFLQKDLQLTDDIIELASPARFASPGGKLYALVGALESEEFIRQNGLISERWGKSVVPICETVPGRNHFDILTDLVDPDARLHHLVLDLLGLQR
jgi:arylformamidase